MPLDLPQGTSCFVDSNILYYALVPTLGISGQCVELLRRAVSGQVLLSISVAVLSDTLHKVMMSEVAQLTGRDRAGIVAYLGKHPEVISKLVEYPKTMDRLKAVPMNVLPVDHPLLDETARIAVQHHLLTNDALIVSLMQRHQLAHLVTNDDDFDGLPDLTIWKPR